MEYFFWGAAGVYLILHGIFRYGLSKSLNLQKSDVSPPPKVSVIVAARNEEHNISRTISSLKNLKYPPHLIEIFLVNDKSTDRTKEIMLGETEGDERFKVIDSRTDETSNLKGKANAIDTAVHLAEGEIILLTDADCEVDELWADEYVKYYEKDTGMVCGVTNIKYHGSLFDKVQSLDLVYLMSLASSSAGINNILSCIGNNISFRKDAYIRTGGYGKIGFSITEDLALMRAIDALEEYKIKYPVNRKNMVRTDSCPDIKSLIRQKKRWFKGGLKINFLGYILGIEMYIINIILLTGFIYMPLPLYFTCVGVKILAELLIMVPLMYRLKLDGLLKFFPVYQVYFAWYGVTLPFFFLFGKKIVWKGRKF
jgi:cellulose synthase/poly-beta-1,6-N-acetylglucosamine synthase-like glycosyltransferase